MATVQCPNCGTINPNGKRLLARCRKCHVNLAACRYCLSYDKRMMDCVHPARPDWLRITDPSEALNCPDFSSIGLATSSLLRRVFRTGTVGAALACALFFGSTRLLHLFTRSGPSVPLRATVSAPAEASADAGLAIRVLVSNQGEVPAESVQVIIGGKSMRDLTCQGVDPPEAFGQSDRRSTSAKLGRLEPGAIASVTFYLTPREPGEVKLVAQVTADNADAPQRIPIEGEILP